MDEKIEYTFWPDSPYAHLERWSDAGKTLCGLEPGRFWITDDEPGNRPLCPECERRRIETLPK